MNQRRSVVRWITVLTIQISFLTLLSPMAHAQTPYGAPAGLVPVTSAAGLAARYAATTDAVREARAVADRSGDTHRSRVFAALSRPGRTFLSFDARGGGQAVEVIGDLATADRVAVVVPGADNDLNTFDARGDDPYKAPGGGALALADAAREIDRGTSLAVVAWLGYRTPSTGGVHVLTDARAKDGAHRLRGLLDTVRAVNPTAGLSLLCHSYGSVVCAETLFDSVVPVTDAALFASPGVDVTNAADLRGADRVWVGRTSDDWIRHVAGEHLLLAGLGIGRQTDPMSARFGARHFHAGNGGHSDYLRPGTRSLRNLAMIALGRAADARH
jgi:hypothetical protein